MRRTPVMLLAALALVPLTIWTATASASAASGTLTVNTLSRTGAKVSTPVKVWNVSSQSWYSLSSGKAKSLPVGTYTITARIWTSRDESQTIATRVLKVSGKMTTTLDARAGQPLKVQLSGLPAGYQQELAARVCSGDDADWDSDAWAAPGKVFVVPNSSKYVKFAFLSTWRPDNGSRNYYLVSGTSSTVPSGMTRLYKTSALGHLTTYVRSGPVGGRSQSLRVVPQNSKCVDGLGGSVESADAPWTAKVHATGGKWTVETDTSAAESGGGMASIGFATVPMSIGAGKNYGLVFNRAAWGPGEYAPYNYGKTVTFQTSGMFRDPGFSYGGAAQSSEASQRSTVTLSFKGKVLKKQVRTDWGSFDTAFFNAPVKDKGWYTMLVDAQRYRPGVTYPKDLLSNRSTARFYFPVDPKKNQQPQLLLSRMQVNGVDATNKAKVKTTTTVDIKLDRKRMNPDVGVPAHSVKSVTVKASFDGGKTWKTVGVRKSGSIWRATLTNPASPNYVALRSTVVDKSGSSAEVTIYRAYRVG